MTAPTVFSTNFQTVRVTVAVGKALGLGVGTPDKGIVFGNAAVVPNPQLLLRGFDSANVSQYLRGGGWNQIAAYMSVAALACAIYGSIFLAAGLVSKNPSVPAALILLWESVKFHSGIAEDGECRFLSPVSVTNRSAA
jgi:hypothetical protein